MSKIKTVNLKNYKEIEFYDKHNKKFRIERELQNMNYDENTVIVKYIIEEYHKGFFNRLFGCDWLKVNDNYGMFIEFSSIKKAIEFIDKSYLALKAMPDYSYFDD